MKDKNKMDFVMATVNSNMQMEESTKVIGNLVLWMDLENFIILI